MTLRPTFRALALGLSLASVVPSVRATADQTPADEREAPPRPKARVYTNEDLDRVHPFAAQTGGSSVAAVEADAKPARAVPPGHKGKGEEHWRGEAARVREKLRALEERAAELRSRIAERSSQSEVFGRRRSSGSSKASVTSLQASLAAVEHRMRLTQEDLEERARRDGALPGWLR